MEFFAGDIVEVLDKVDLQTKVRGIVKFIEPDNEFEGLYWLYIVADEETLNTQIDSRIGNYWGIYEMDNPYITLLSRATNN